ncbi:MAG: 50S ribosomal protein L10, partial [Acidimicrobiales bacterium]
DAVILTEYRGLRVKDLATLRRELRKDGGEYKVYKNTLVRFATRSLGLHELDGMLEGPTAIAFVNGDPAAVAKTLRDYSRTNQLLVIKGGVLGSKVLDAAGTAALAELPPREVLLGRLAGALAAPLQQFASLLQALPRNFAYGLAALRDKRVEEGGAAPAADEAAAEPSATEPDPEAPAAETPVESEAAAEAPAAETPVEESAEEPPAGETPAGETPAD